MTLALALVAARHPAALNMARATMRDLFRRLFGADFVRNGAGPSTIYPTLINQSASRYAEADYYWTRWIGPETVTFTYRRVVQMNFNSDMKAGKWS
jgi:hypothetical protein